MSKKNNKRRGLTGWISSAGGQRFFNFAYSIGAAIVIWGALFKILHLPGGNTLLSIGMGTEVLMFILSAFDRPAKEYDWAEVFPQLRKNDEDNEEEAAGIESEPTAETDLDAETADAADSQADAPAAASGAAPGGVVIVGQVSPQAPAQGGTVYAAAAPAAQADPSAAAAVCATAGGVAVSTEQYVEQLNGITEQLAKLQSTTQALNEVSRVLLESYRVITENSDSITAGSQAYVDEMQNLGRNIGGLNTIYEIQLKSVSSQLDAIDRVNRGIKDIRDMYEKSAQQSARYCEESERMARYMQQLNSVYERMITAMTVNMYNPLMPQQPQQSQPEQDK